MASDKLNEIVQTIQQKRPSFPKVERVKFVMWQWDRKLMEYYGYLEALRDVGMMTADEVKTREKEMAKIFVDAIKDEATRTE